MGKRGVEIGNYRLVEVVGTGVTGRIFRVIVEADGKPVPRGDHALTAETYAVEVLYWICLTSGVAVSAEYFKPLIWVVIMLDKILVEVVVNGLVIRHQRSCNGGQTVGRLVEGDCR
jgi:hypothetical protein